MKWYDCLNKASSHTEALELYKEARAPRDYKREYAQYHSKPQRVAERSQRNQARRIVGLEKGDPREVDHKIPLSRGGSNARSNLRAVSLQANRKKFTKTANYREGGSFTHDGKRYNLNSALEVADSKQVVNIPVKSLDWVLKHDTPTPSRVVKADVTAPVLVAPDSMGRPTVIDGLHRLTKAKKQGLTSLPARKLSRKDLSLVENRKKFTKTANDRKETLKEQLGLGAVGLGAGIGLAAQDTDRDLNISSKLYYNLFKNPNRDVNLTEDQVQTLRQKMSPSTQVPTFEQLKSGLTGGKKLTDSELEAQTKRQGWYYRDGDFVVAHRGKNGGSKRGEIVAHELAHGKLNNKPIAGKLMRAADSVSRLGYLGIPASLMASTEEGTLENRIGDMAQYGGLVAHAPTLIDEGYANIEGYRNLKRLGISPEELAHSRKSLARGMGSYLAGYTPTIAAPFLLREAKRRYDKSKSGNKEASLLQQSAADDRERTYAEMRDAIRGFSAKQNIDPEKAMLVAGGAGYMHGMRDEVNDLDFFHDDLPGFVQEPYGRFDMDGGPGKDLPDAAKQYQMMHGMRVQTPEAMLAFYQRLNRPKDQEKIKMLQAHLKTASYRPRVDSIIYKRENGKLKVLAAKDDTLSAQGIGFQSSPYSFPGGGVEPDQDPISAAQMEAMEEAGVMGKDFKLISSKPKRISLDQDWRDRQYKKRGERLKGVYNYSVIGEYDQDNNSILGRDNDAWNFSWYPAEDVVASLKNDKGQFRAANKVNARALSSLLKTARNSSLVEKRAARLYHGSPYEGLTSLQPREPRGNTDYERQKAVFMMDNPDAAALYALARDKERKNRGWAAIGGRLQLGPGANLNEKGYIYNVDTDNYLSPPKGEESRGFAIPREINVSGVKEVTPAEYEHLIDRFDTKDGFNDHIQSLINKTAAVATKTDPAKWEAAKQEAKSKMGGKHSARAMQLATKIYKDNGGGYSGAKPTSSTNSLKKWTKQDWGYSGKDTPGQGGSGVYLPKRRREALKSTKQGRKLLASATSKKHKATKDGKQYSSHGLAAGTSLEKRAIDPRLTMWLMDKAQKTKSPMAKKLLNSASDASHTLATGAWDMYADKPTTKMGRMFKATHNSAKDVVEGTNPAMATTHAKLKFVGDSGLGSQVIDAGRSVADAGKAMAEGSTTMGGKLKGRVIQGAGNVASAGGWWQGNMPDWLPGLW